MKKTTGKDKYSATKLLLRARDLLSRVCLTDQKFDWVKEYEKLESAIVAHAIKHKRLLKAGISVPSDPRPPVPPVPPEGSLPVPQGEALLYPEEYRLKSSSAMHKLYIAINDYADTLYREFSLKEHLTSCPMSDEPAPLVPQKASPLVPQKASPQLTAYLNEVSKQERTTKLLASLSLESVPMRIGRLEKVLTLALLQLDHTGELLFDLEGAYYATRNK